MNKGSKRENSNKKFSESEPELTFSVDQLILAQNKSNIHLEGEWRDAKIINIRPASKKKTENEKLELYIHYEGSNRRCDE